MVNRSSFWSTKIFSQDWVPVSHLWALWQAFLYMPQEQLDTPYGNQQQKQKTQFKKDR